MLEGGPERVRIEPAGYGPDFAQLGLKREGQKGETLRRARPRGACPLPPVGGRGGVG
jgi:hypothetical protein